MSVYEVTLSQTVEVVARSEEHALQLANEEILENPDFQRSVKCTAVASMTGIAEFLKGYGFTVYLDTWGNNISEIIRINYTPLTENQDESDYQFSLVPNLNQYEIYDGTGFTLASEGYELVTVGHGSPSEVAELVANALEVRRPAMVATLEEIVELLNASGVTATVVDFGRYEGQPKVIEIGNTLPVALNGDRIQTPEWTLFQNLNDDGHTIAGTGYHLSFEDDESKIVAEIGNETAPRIVYAIATAIATAKVEHLSKWGNA